MSHDHLRCATLVDAITEYLDDVLEPTAREQIDMHLAECPDCRAALDQFRRTIELAGTLSPAALGALEPSTRERLLASFRSSLGPE